MIITIEEAIRKLDAANAKAQKWEEIAGSYASLVNDLQNDNNDLLAKVYELESRLGCLARHSSS